MTNNGSESEPSYFLLPPLNLSIESGLVAIKKAVVKAKRRGDPNA
jgi:hypothetical protein